MNAYPILYSFRRCPYAIRGRMALIKSGVIYELREVSLRNKPEGMISVSPKGTVPVLQLTDETVLDESIKIMRWALYIRDPDNWLSHINETSSLLSKIDKSFKDALDKYKYFVNYPKHPQRYYRERGEKYLAMLEEKLIATHGQGLCDTRTTFADIAIFPFVRQFAFVDKTWFDKTPYSFLKKWLTCHLESELFLSVMHKESLWKPGDKVLFGQKTAR